ncbi:MAG TPA: hypothetical protein VND24_01730 [Steroidobacteraceae bacterium]|nr:hypothetical protein [Steroidobacteraceae bacterium]
MHTFPARTAIFTLSLAFAAAAHAGTFQRQVPADPHGEVDISNVAGSIAISGWDNSAVAVSADLPGGTERVKVTSRQGRTRVCVTYGSGGCDAPIFSGGKEPVRLELHVPRGSEIDASGVSARITSHGMLGVQHLRTVSGDIEADLGSGDDDVKSVSGAIRLHGSGQDGTLHASTVSGDLSISDIAGELDARTVNGTLTAGLSPARAARLNTTSGAIGLNAHLAPGGTIEVETVSGNEKIDVSAAAGYSYDARTFSGNIENCFGQQPDRSHYGPGNRLDGSRGAANGRIRLRSLSGDISLCDR